VAIEIDKPTCKRDYDQIRWYLLHDRVTVFVDHDGDWHVEFEADCSAVGPDHRCKAYEQRPRVCRDYPGGDEECEHVAEDSPYAMRFLTAGDFETYLDAKGIDWRWKRQG
jgi:Fe-S-cluster containining protein